MAQLMLFTPGAETIPMGLEAQKFIRSNKQTPTLSLIQKIWNKGRQLQGVQGFTDFSPIWENRTYVELAKLQQGPRWHVHGVTLLSHIFENGKLLSFLEMQDKFKLPATIWYSYLQLRRAENAQGDAGEWTLSPTPVFHMLHYSTATKGIISQCYQMLLARHLWAYPCRAVSAWENDLGQLTGDQ